MGTQGSLDNADTFVAETGLQSAVVLWDDAFRIWRHYDVFAQPTAILVSASGEVLHTFGGRFRAEDVLSRI